MSLVPHIEHEGQEFYDEADKRGKNAFHAAPSGVATAVMALFGSEAPELINGRFNRIPLRWMKPGPDGKLVPKGKHS